MTEKTKKWLKIAGIVTLVLVLYGMFNIKTNLKGTETGKFEANSLSVSSVGENDGRWNQSSTKDSTAGSTSEMEIADMEAGTSMLSTSPAKSESQTVSQVDKKIIKDGSLTLKVEKTEEAAREIAAIAKNLGGEIFSSNFHERVKGSKTGYMTIKIPSDKFDQAMDETKKVSTQIVNESSNAQDVTEQYVDLKAQLKNKKAEEEAFLKILDRSGKISDVLSVTREVSRVRGEIERLQAKINYMESQTSKATITVSLSEDVEITPIGDDWRPWQVVKSSLKQLTKNFQDFVDSFIKFIIIGLPQLLVIFLVVWFVIWIGKKIFRKIKGKASSTNSAQ